MNQIVKFAVKYPVTVLMLTLAICLLGMISYNKLGTDLFPDMKNPALYIDLQAGERPPEEMERQFVKNIEAIAARQDGVQNVYSESSVGYAQITVEYDWEQDMDAAYLDLQRSLATITANSEITSLNVMRYDANASPVMTIALRHKEIQDMNELRKIAENYMRNELVRLDGVADIQLNGQETAIVKVKTDPYLLEAYNLTVDAISNRIEELLQNVSGGTIVNEDIQYTIKGVNIVKNLEDISDVIVTFKDNSSAANTTTNNGTTATTTSSTKAPVYLKDVAIVELANQDPENIVRFNGTRSIGLSIYKENKYNTVKVVETINEKLNELRRSMPAYEFDVVSDQGTFIKSAVDEVKDSALMGIVLAVIIIYVFLRRINTTLIVSLSIPVSIIATFNLMYFSGLTLNIMTLGGLALGAGMLVDNAIVVTENIFRNLQNGMSPKEAAIKGTSEVGGAITSSTLTTIVVFLPIIYVHGAAGELFKEQAWVVTFSLISSLFVAILLLPMLASKFFKKTDKAVNAIQFKGYARFVGRLLKRRWTVIGSAIVLTVAAYFLLPLIGMEFMPRAESKEFNVMLSLKPGSRLQTTDYAAASVEAVLQDIAGDDLEWVYILSGPSNTENEVGKKAEDESRSQLKVKLRKESKTDAGELISKLIYNTNLPDDVEITYEKEQSALQSVLGTETAPVVVEIKGEELDVLERLSQEVKEKMTGIDGIYEIKTTMEKGAPEVDLSIDRLRSGIYGIDISGVAQQVCAKLEGKSAGSFDRGGEQVGIEIRVPEITFNELSDVEIVQGEKKYRLGEIAELSIVSAPKEIIRNNQSRIVQVTALLDSKLTLSKITPKIETVLSSVDFPSGYFAKITGEEEKRAESFGGLSFALLLSIILVYMVMAAQFESLRHPFTILLTIPLAFVGTIFTFLLTGSTLNMMAFIGIIMLAGIAVNSSIILVDRINQLKAEGLPLADAIQTASSQRIRPILMTALSTILALLPMCFGFGEGASLRSPMALAVIGGLITATLLTLIVIPCVYFVIDKKSK
ncbi:MAG: efflux RND transporter permease subunit [Culturomica sp.]|jgi:HAE1 family hydrophobic/amphiphilic exporter-1|nr:efflux RND transporter permease subunit [Culturomica sp.]